MHLRHPAPGRPGALSASPTVLLAVLLTVLLVVAGPARAAPLPRGGAEPLPVVPAGVFGWPLAGVDPAGPAPVGGTRGSVARRFLPPPTPYGRGHRGADLAADAGAPVLAAGPGTVVYAGLLAGRGVVSVVHADGLRTTYEPVRAAVAVGAPVARGSPLGVLEPGHRGCPRPACLHWGLRRVVPGQRDEQYLDPLLLVGLGRPRLLPLDGGVG